MPSDVFFTSNPSDYQQLEGLYLTEIQPPGFIRGVDLDTVGFAGKCVRGPVTPQQIDSVARFIEVYGSRDYGSGGSLVGEIWKALLNKPFASIVVRRVAASAAATASKTLSDVTPTVIVTVHASSPGLWGNSLQTTVSAATDANANHFNLTITYLGSSKTYQNLSVFGSDNNLAAIIGDDIGNWVTVTKTANGRPLNSSIANLTSGTDGSLAAADYISGVDDLAAYDGVDIVLVPESLEDSVGAASQATLNAELVTLAAAASDRIFLSWSGVWANTYSQEITAWGTQVTTQSDRLWWCFNYTTTLDGTLGLQINQAPHVWLASILCQNDVDIHAGSQQTQKQTAGITALGITTLSRTALIALRNSGISTLERVNGGFQFRSVVTTSLTPGKTEGSRRRMADFLELSAAARLATFVKDKNIASRRAQMAAELTSFSTQLKDQERIVEDFSVDNQSGNTTLLRSEGQETIIWRVKLIGHILYLVFQTNISTGTIIQVQ